MLKELIDKQRTYTNHFFERFDSTEMEKLVDSLVEKSGIIFFSGVGKSGLIAKKVAFTMSSTGTRALFISPVDALHGDLGMVSSHDTFIILSKSGESDELMQLIPAIRNKGATLIGVVCNEKSRFARACDQIIHLPFQAELCPFDMAPTMSTTFQLLIGDLLTVALMKRKNFTLNEYALNHPSGRLGKRITLKVKDLMLTGEKMPLCYPDDLLKNVLTELTDKRCGCLLVVDSTKKLNGLFTDGDLRRALQNHGGKVLDYPIEKLMSVNIQTIQPEELAWDALKLMEANPQKRFTILPVINSERRIEGLIHLHDLVQSGL